MSLCRALPELDGHIETDLYGALKQNLLLLIGDSSVVARLMQLLIDPTSGVGISGSLVLKALTDASWPCGDADFFVDCKNDFTVKAPHMPPPFDKIDGLSVPHGGYENPYDFPGTDYIFYDRKTKVQVMAFSPGCSARLWVNGFDFTILKNYYMGGKLHVMHPWHVLRSYTKLCRDDRLEKDNRFYVRAAKYVYKRGIHLDCPGWDNTAYITNFFGMRPRWTARQRRCQNGWDTSPYSEIEKLFLLQRYGDRYDFMEEAIDDGRISSACMMLRHLYPETESLPDWHATVYIMDRDAEFTC